MYVIQFGDGSLICCLYSVAYRAVSPLALREIPPLLNFVATTAKSNYQCLIATCTALTNNFSFLELPATSSDKYEKLPVVDSNEASPPPYAVQVVQPGVS